MKERMGRGWLSRWMDRRVGWRVSSLGPSLISVSSPVCADEIRLPHLSHFVGIGEMM